MHVTDGKNAIIYVACLNLRRADLRIIIIYYNPRSWNFHVKTYDLKKNHNHIIIITAIKNIS